MKTLFNKVLDDAPVSECGGVMQSRLSPAVWRQQINPTTMNLQQLKPHTVLWHSTSATRDGCQHWITYTVD